MIDPSELDATPSYSFLLWSDHIHCAYCSKDYQVYHYEGLLWFLLDETLDPVRRRQTPMPGVQCLTATGRLSRVGFACTYRWHVPSRQLEVLVLRRPNAKSGRFWPLGLVLWKLKE